MIPGQEINCDNLGIFFLDFLHSNCVLSVLIRFASKSVMFSLLYTE